MIKQGYEQEFIICLKSLYLELNKSPCEMTHILSNYKIFPDFKKYTQLPVFILLKLK